MNSETVHLIATDPPFKKGRDFHATPNSLAAGARFPDRWSWRDDIQGGWLNKIIEDYPEVWSVIASAKIVYGDDMAAYLCWLGVRLLEMHRILRADGSLYLHIDHTAHAYVKCLLDAIFGYKNFRNEIVWCYTGPSNTKRWFPRKHDTILFYTKSDSWVFNADDVRIPYSDKYVKRFSKQYNEGADKSTIFTKGHDTKRNQELAEKGKLPEDWWSNFSPVGRRKNENTGYPTQKPLALYNRIIEASSNKDDIVLDPFCGCATTPIAAERLGRQWVGMDVWEEAYKIVLERLEQEKLAVAEAEKARQPHLMTFGDVHYSKAAPIRTDRGEPATWHLKTPTGRVSKRYPPPRAQHEKLLTDLGTYCQGCGNNYGFDPRVLEVDHVLPKADGGTDAYDNLTLLCPPCNKEKRDRLTLSGLQAQNRQNGYLKQENEANISRGRASRKRRKIRRRR